MRAEEVEEATSGGDLDRELERRPPTRRVQESLDLLLRSLSEDSPWWKVGK